MSPEKDAAWFPCFRVQEKIADEKLRQKLIKNSSRWLVAKKIINLKPVCDYIQ